MAGCDDRDDQAGRDAIKASELSWVAVATNESKAENRQDGNRPKFPAWCPLPSLRFVVCYEAIGFAASGPILFLRNLRFPEHFEDLR